MKILGISGRKQSGKNTTANIIHGLVLDKYGLVDNWTIGDDGELNVLTRDRFGNLGWGELDVTRKDPEFTAYADHNIWPYVKLYSFADTLKWICTELFDIPRECVWGTNEQKNMVQKHLLWENMPGVTTEKTPQNPVTEEVAGRLGKYYEKVLSGVVYHEPGPMTAREFMQFFGTEICRKMFEPIWINATIKKIQHEQPELALIADVRFPNEARAIDEAGGIVTRLKRVISPEDTHPSETSMDNYPFNYVIDNEDESLASFIVKVREFYTLHLEPQAIK